MPRNRVAIAAAASWLLSSQETLSFVEAAVPCAPLAADDACTYDVAACSSVPPGGSCEVGCLAPYVGNATVAVCPKGNSDPLRRVTFHWPRCTVDCPEPAVVPEGYEQGPDGWRCAVGFGGRVVKSCARRYVRRTGCTTMETTLSGCMPRCTRQCGADAVFSSLETCELEACPASAPDPVPIPPGYVKVDAQGNWRCAAGYVGHPRRTCRAVGSYGCDLRATLDGCFRGSNAPGPTRYRLVHVSGERTLSSGFREVDPSEIADRIAKAGDGASHEVVLKAMLQQHDAAILLKFLGPGCSVARSTHKSKGKDRAFSMAETYAQAFEQQCQSNPTEFYA
eukprot:TRINITY_DN16038_c0_g1_i1.p1 TRINITY_DN16038_c0_g1~~TRINITY_DN16038_c0_g1_i1.p1  ORF type:complete len:355 (+),score=46.51 TRINITY_DN16038_c0_g1_i1:57-1067(+)